VRGDLLGFAGAALVLASGALWVRRMRAVRVPRTRAPYLGAMALGALLGVAALVRGTGLPGGAAAALAIALGAAFVGLRLQSAQVRSTPAVGEGDAMLDFTAPGADGRPFASASLHGRPYLLKFFRGHW
jgi:cytochrome oxidase Cu insertion factor (SCO1/SenC/PrrC family)